MANAYIKTLEVKRVSANGWAVIVNGKVKEQSSNEDAARAAAAWWERNYRKGED